MGPANAGQFDSGNLTQATGNFELERDVRSEPQTGLEGRETGEETYGTSSIAAIGTGFDAGHALEAAWKSRSFATTATPTWAAILIPSPM